MIVPQKKKKMNPMLMKVIIISVLIHVAAGFVAGVITIATHVIQEDTQFEEPPAIQEEEPPPEVKVQIKPQQPKMQPAQRLTMRPVANIAVANIDVDLPSIDQSFTVSAGIGGVGGGNLLAGARGSIGMGMSDVSVFGLKTRAERILFVIDTNRQMVTDKKGGLNSYKVIKDEITDMVGNLSAGTLFNVMLQDRKKTMLFKPRLTPAGSESHTQLVQWISTINSDAATPGLESNPQAKIPNLTAQKDNELQKILAWSGHGGNETGFITQVALEQNADAVFLITGYHRGFENIIGPASDQQTRDWERLIATRKYQEQLAAHKLEVPTMQQRINNQLARINADRAQKGQPARVLNQRYGIYSNANELGIQWETSHPGHGAGHQQIDTKDVIKYFKALNAELYEDYNRTPPSVNVVLFLAGDEVYQPEWKKQLDQYVRFFRGKNRVIRGGAEIIDARSSKSIKN